MNIRDQIVQLLDEAQASDPLAGVIFGEEDPVIIRQMISKGAFETEHIIRVLVTQIAAQRKAIEALALVIARAQANSKI